MVQLNSSFSEAKFAQWKRGPGFGAASRDYLFDKSVPMFGRHTPSGDGYFRANAFYKTRWEQDSAWSFSKGPRKGNELMTDQYNPKIYANPTSYDPNISTAKRDLIYKNLKIKQYYEPPEMTYSRKKQSPGPCAYDTRKPFGYMAPKFSILNRHLDTALVNESQFKPGPDAYNTRGVPGGSLRKITMTGRPRLPRFRKVPPGPGAYTVPGDFDRFGLEPPGWVPPFVKG